MTGWAAVTAGREVCAPDRDCWSIGHLTPALSHSSSMPLQISSFFSAPASTTSWTLAWVITWVGSSSAWILWLRRLGVLERVSLRPAEAGSLPPISAIASWAGRVGLEADVLEDRHALLAGDDVLDTGDAGVLTGDDHVAVEPLVLEHADDRVGDVVVGREHALDLTVGRGERLVEGRSGVLDQPALDGGLLLDGELAFLLQRVEHRVRPLLEQHRVVVDVGAAVHHDDLRLLDLLRVEAVDHRLRLELADLLVVEGDVVGRRATEVGRS